MSALPLRRSSGLSLAWPRFPASLLGLFICLAGGILVLRPLLDPDLGWHVRTGSLILATHHIPTVDPYSFTKAGAPWVEHEWLWQVAAAALNALGGQTAIVLANGAAVSGVLAFIYLRLRTRRIEPAYAAAGAGVALANLAVYAEARPGQVVALFTAAMLFGFERYRRGGNWRWLGVAPAAELLWANSHGSYVLGLLLCGLYGLAALWETGRWGALAPWALTGAAAVAASLINPLGVGLYRFTLGASQLSVNRQLVHEWKPPDFSDLSFAPILLTVLLLLALPAFLRVSPRGRAQQLLLVAGAGGALQSQQFILFFAVAAAPLAGELLQEAWPSRALTRLSAGSAVALALTLLGLTLAGPVTRLTPGAYHQAVAADYPVDAVAFIEAHQLAGPMWNEVDWGGYLIGALPRLPVFVDARTEMYGQRFEAETAAITFGTKPVAPVLQQYGIKLAMVNTHGAVAGELRALPGWRQAYSDKLAAVFVRAD